MKAFFITLVLLCGVLAYIRVKQPQIWNNCLSVLTAPSAASAEAPPVATAVTEPTPAPLPPPVPVVPKDTPTIISPSSTNFLNPDHVRPVVQPNESPNSPAPAAGKTTNTSAAKPIPKTIPSTITTLSGKTYTGCVLSKVTPDGISFIDSSGGAKVLFSDLDPKLAADFNYDPAAAKKYQADQATQRQQEQAAYTAAVRAQAQARAQASNTSDVASVDSSSGNSAAASAVDTNVRMSDEQREDVENKIADLTGEIDRMERDSAGETAQLGGAGGSPMQAGGAYSNPAYAISSAPEYTGKATQTKGSYSEAIAQEKQQLGELKEQLSNDRSLISVRVLSAEERQSIKTQIVVLKHDIYQLSVSDPRHLVETTKTQLRIDDLMAFLSKGRFYPVEPMKLTHDDVVRMQNRAIAIQDFVDRRGFEHEYGGRRAPRTVVDESASVQPVGYARVDSDQSNQEFLEESDDEAKEEISEIDDQLRANGSSVAAATPAKTLSPDEKASYQARIAALQAEMKQLQNTTVYSDIGGGSHAEQLVTDAMELKKLNDELARDQ